MSTTSTPRPRHNAEYYIRGGDLTIRVDRVIFRVHRFFFERDSRWFRTRLAHPASPGMPSVGTSDSNAFVLEGVTPAQFEQFLWVFYNPKYSVYQAQLRSWLVILELAHKWEFIEVKNLVARQLEHEDIDPVEKIDIFQRYNLERNFLFLSYSALCSQTEPPSLSKCRTLGIQTAHRIFTARERYQRNEDSLPAIVADVFEVELINRRMVRPMISTTTTARTVMATDGPSVVRFQGEDRQVAGNALYQDAKPDGLHVHYDLGQIHGDDDDDDDGADESHDENAGQGNDVDSDDNPFSPKTNNPADASDRLDEGSHDDSVMNGEEGDIPVEIEPDVLVQVGKTETANRSSENGNEDDDRIVFDGGSGQSPAAGSQGAGTSSITTRESDGDTREQNMDTAQSARSRSSPANGGTPGQQHTENIDQNRGTGEAESIPVDTAGGASNTDESGHSRKSRRKRRIVPDTSLYGDDDNFEDDETFDSPNTPFRDDIFGTWDS